MDIVVPGIGNSQLQWSIIGSDMPSALGLVSFFSWKPSKLDFGEEMDSRSHFRIITINKNKEYLTEWVGLDEVIMFSFTISETANP